MPPVATTDIDVVPPIHSDKVVTGWVVIDGSATIVTAEVLLVTEPQPSPDALTVQ